MSQTITQLFLINAILASAAVSGCRTSWDQTYFQHDVPGNAVEFSGEEYAIRTHEGKGYKQGEWAKANKERSITSCCKHFDFELKENHLVDNEGNKWTLDPPDWPLRRLDRKTVKVEVVDKDSKVPVPEFRYRYS
ncbi:MAG: hypothetical protein ACOC6C_03725, partial [Verrucomicrobiota bacterium]